MRKGISPIVAVVLLIAIAVIAAVGLYFWVGGLATKQPTPNAPIVISAQKVTCTLGTPSTENSTLTVLVQNLDASQDIEFATSPLQIVDDDGRTVTGVHADILAGQQGTVTWVSNATTNVSLTSGNTYPIYASGTGQAQIIC